MGIDITCCGESVAMSYSGWAYFRQDLIKITFAYLEKLPVDDSHYFSIMSEFCKAMGTFEKGVNDNGPFDRTVFNLFFQNITNHFSYVDALIYFGVGGLYSLCYKSDCDGLYSPGNSLDICNFFDLMKEHIKAYDEIMYDRIYIPDDGDSCIYDVFHQSWKNNEVVLIT